MGVFGHEVGGCNGRFDDLGDLMFDLWVMYDDDLVGEFLNQRHYGVMVKKPFHAFMNCGQERFL